MANNDVINVASNAMDVQQSVTQVGYSKVIINIPANNKEDEKSYIAGNDTGVTLEFTNPWGTQKMADDLLNKIMGVEYQPYRVTGGLINPAAELGDAVSTNGVYGGLYEQDSYFTHQFYADYSAPQDEQLDHEFTYESPIERHIVRNEVETRAEFKLVNDEISARVTKEGGNEDESFSWSLQSNGFTLYSGHNPVFACNHEGLIVNGSGTFSGSLSAATGTFAGSLSAATGTFAGSLSAATGTFAGSLSAATGTFVGSLSAATGTFHGGIQCSSITFDNGVTLDGAYLRDNTISDGKISGLSGSKVGSGINGGNINSGSVGDTQISNISGTKVGAGINGNNLNDASVPKGKTSTTVQNNLNNGQAAKDKLDSIDAGSATLGWLKADSVQAKTLRVYKNGVYQIASWKSKTISDVSIEYLGHD